MADITSKKYAIIINPDSEARHLENVEASLAILEQSGYETHVFSPTKPKSAHDYYRSVESTNESLLELQKTITANDEVLIYSSGHGSRTESGDPQLCIDTVCGDRDVFSLLNFKQAKERTIIMDQCFSGGYAKQFAAQPNTLFVSPGSEGQTVVCNQFAPFFWSQSATDYNNDGTISFQERYQFALDQNRTETKSQFIPTVGYNDEGSAKFPNSVQNIATAGELSSLLATLRPGQFAFVLFSASWCGPCKVYKPQFESFASDAQGQYLFIRTENEDLARQYDVASYPTIKIIDHAGKITDVSDRMELFTSLQYTTTNQATLYRNAIDLLQSSQAEDHHTALTELLYLSSGLNEEQAKLAIDAMQRMLTSHGDKHDISELLPIYDAIYSDLIHIIPRGTLMELVDKYVLSLLNSKTDPKTADLMLLTIMAYKASPALRERFIEELSFEWIDQIQPLDRKFLATHALHSALDSLSVEQQTDFFSKWIEQLPNFLATTRMMIYLAYGPHFIAPESTSTIVEDTTLFILTATNEQLTSTNPHLIFDSLAAHNKLTSQQADKTVRTLLDKIDQLPLHNFNYTLAALNFLIPYTSPILRVEAEMKLNPYMIPPTTTESR